MESPLISAFLSSSPSAFPASFIVPWTNLLLSHRDARSADAPNYHRAQDIDSLITTSLPRSLRVGTGHSIFSTAILPAIASAKRSVHFVTCFWAASPSLDGLREGLTELAASRSRSASSLRVDGQGQPLPTLRVSIGFSSRSLFQKLFHTSSLDGHVYAPRDWPKLGLPDEKLLRRGGIEMTVKSLFFTPISVLHPKYVIVDGSKAWVPSCNVSWERWFEGCVELQGDVVDALLAFHARVWGPANAGNDDSSSFSSSESGVELSPQIRAASRSSEARDASTTTTSSSTSSLSDEGPWADERMQSAAQAVRVTGSIPVPTVLLPSPHHRNPRFRFFFFLLSPSKPPPMTPLNAALMTLFANARREIHIITPNVTSRPVLEALLAALARGVDVQIRTSKRLMLFEQLITAGTTTSWCLKKLVKRYRRLVEFSQRPLDPEVQPLSPGKLEIFYYKQLAHRKGKEDEPSASHLKMTMVDGEYLVLGSGNMDRASWYTSQELGLLLFRPGLEEGNLWETVLEQRAEVMFRSGS